MGDSFFIGKREIVVVGDRLLVSPSNADERTDSGLYLPDSAEDGKQVTGGWVEAVGPGYPVPAAPDPTGEPWKTARPPDVHYFPLQARKGDFAMFIRKSAYEIRFEGKKLFVVPNSSVLLLLRDRWDGTPLAGEPVAGEAPPTDEGEEE
ncbi:co-chaperone GroES [Candidatus Fermentibacterales bacterium]|nr:co-chaperone GroES [Candidatus Fermentibacterales bacterium]